MKVILHIGPHKTGTTTIQRTLHRNSALLMKHKVYYGSVAPDHYNHHAFAIELRKGSKEKEWAIEAVLAQIGQAAEAGCHTCIFSSEMFIENPDVGLVRDIFAGHALQIIAYLRRPDELVASAYNEIVRHPNQRWPRAIGERPYAYDPSYSDILTQWLTEFGPDTFTLAPFDPDQWPESDIVVDFLRMIGLKDRFLLDRDFSDADMNFSLPASLIEVVRMTNAVVPMSPETQGAFVRSIYELRKQYPDFYPSEVSLMDRQQRQECLRMLAKQLPRYRPYFRSGFNERFLRRRRPTLREWIARKLARV